MKFELPKLEYGYGDLEPYIDAKTMEIHHSKHHAAYVNKLNEALAKHPELPEMTLEKLVCSLVSLPEDIRTAVRNNGGGHLNHSFFWTAMKKGGGGNPSGKLLEALTASFGGFEKFREAFLNTAATFFGSGWVWLVFDKEGKAAVTSTADHLTPLANGETPLLVLDVWEHAYYLKYQNRRPEYIEAWWNVVDWDAVAKNLESRM